MSGNRVSLGHDSTQGFFHMGHEGAALHTKVNLLSVVGDDSLILLPVDELTPIVGKPLAPFDAKSPDRSSRMTWEKR